MDRLDPRPRTTMSGIELDAVYGPADAERPGEYPYTRGPYASMYRSKLWTMRMFAGFGTADVADPKPTPKSARAKARKRALDILFEADQREKFVNPALRFCPRDARRPQRIADIAAGRAPEHRRAPQAAREHDEGLGLERGRLRILRHSVGQQCLDLVTLAGSTLDARETDRGRYRLGWRCGSRRRRAGSSAGFRTGAAT